MPGRRFLHTGAYLRRRPVGLAVGAIFRNEARYLPEWIEFHLRQGVERFYLYENNSTDDWRSALAPYARAVELHHWHQHPGQSAAYTDCVRQHRADTRWLALIDVDEFLFSPTGRSLPEVLRAVRWWVGAIVVNWRCYGTSGHERSPGGPVLNSYTWRAADDHPLNRWVKSIVFPAVTVLPIRHPHIVRSYGVTCDEYRHRVSDGPYRAPATADVLRINHYVTRSRQEWERKLSVERAWSPTPRPALNLEEFEAVNDPILAR